MNITEFINSTSIANYLEKIKYKFNAIEAAYLVWQCKKVSIREKIAAWQEITETMPDMAVKARRWGWDTDEPSVHAFLKKYIGFMKEDINKFYEPQEALYTFSVLHERYTEWSCDNRIFTSYELCERELHKELVDRDYEMYTVKKIIPNSDKSIECKFLKNGDISEVYVVDPDSKNDEKKDCMLRFMGLWFAFPTPFKKGDIVYLPNSYEIDPRPFVLLEMSSWGEKELRENGYTDENKIEQVKRLVKIHEQYGDDTDMLASGYYVDECGEVYWGHTEDTYLDLEYYDKELSGEKRVLIALSNYVRKKIDIVILVNAYRIIMDKTRIGQIKNHIGCVCLDEHLQLAGLK